MSCWWITWWRCAATKFLTTADMTHTFRSLQESPGPHQQLHWVSSDLLLGLGDPLYLKTYQDQKGHSLSCVKQRPGRQVCSDPFLTSADPVDAYLMDGRCVKQWAHRALRSSRARLLQARVILAMQCDLCWYSFDQEPDCHLTLVEQSWVCSCGAAQLHAVMVAADFRGAPADCQHPQGSCWEALIMGAGIEEVSADAVAPSRCRRCSRRAWRRRQLQLWWPQRPGACRYHTECY